MGETVNLRQVRKQRERTARRAEADANAARFGRSKTERQLQQARAEKARSELEAHKREQE